MTDPISGQVASQAMEALQQSGATDGPASTGGANGFDQTLQGADSAQEPAAIDSEGGVEATSQVEAIEQVDEIPTDDFVQRLLGEESQIEEMMDKCLNGGDLGQEDMLQMQSVIYAYSQRVELTSKVVDNATSGIKQVMNTQV